MSGTVNEVLQRCAGDLHESRVLSSGKRRSQDARIDGARLVVLSLVAAGCATADASRVEISPPARPTVADGYGQVLVAGF